MYLFENKEKIPFKDLTAEQMKMVASANYIDVEELIRAGLWVQFKVFESISLDSIYRVKAKPYTIEDAKEEILKAISDTSSSTHAITTTNSAFDKLSASMESDS